MLPVVVKLPPTEVLPVVLIVLAVTEFKVKLVSVNAVAISEPAIVKVPVTGNTGISISGPKGISI